MKRFRYPLPENNQGQLYMTKDDLEIWDKITSLSQPTLLRKVLELIPEDELEMVENEMYVEALKKSLGIKYKIPEQYNKNLWKEYDWPDEELIPIKT